LPLIIAFCFLVVGGVALQARAARQARDTIRKHHLDDIEHALYKARDAHGTFPPYDQATWCGFLNDPKNQSTKTEVEQALRQYNQMYANQAKPFPTDPKPGWDYFYWKRSPAVFELYANLEQAPTKERNSNSCPTAPPRYFDYGITSIWRETGASSPAL